MADEVTVSEVVVTAPKKRRSAGGVRFGMPQISVVLKKNIGRAEAAGGIPVSQRFKEAAREIDLTPYLGLNSAITTQRSVRDGAGMFSITLGDQLHPEQQESLYGLIEPLDVIEIRMARDISKTSEGLTKRMPIIMRGIVSGVAVQRTLTEQGPVRQVVINGQDYGKVLQMLRVVYLPGMVLGQNLLSSFKLFLNYDAGGKSYQDVGEFVKDILDNVINPFLAKMRDASAPATESPIVDLTLESSVTDGTVSPFGVQQWAGGSIYDLLKLYGDVGPFNELFVEDREEGPFLVFRPNPFKDADGVFIQDGADADLVDIYDESIVQETSRRSEENVVNYFWVDAPSFSLIESSTVQLAANGQVADPEPLVDDYQNCSPDLYGLRLLQVSTQQGDRVDSKTEDEMKAGNEVNIALMNRKRDILIRSNRDNVVLEEGSITMRGDETVRPGTYLRITRGGGFEYQVYAHTVQHQFTPLSGFMTSVEYDRGTGFIERSQKGRGATSPYFSGMTLRGVYGG